MLRPTDYIIPAVCYSYKLVISSQLDRYKDNPGSNYRECYKLSLFMETLGNPMVNCIINLCTTPA